MNDRIDYLHRIDDARNAVEEQTFARDLDEIAEFETYLVNRWSVNRIV